jgi:hypothetical protein
VQFPQFLLDLVYVLVNHIHLKLQLLLSLDLLLVLARAQLPVLILHPLFVYLHSREGILEVVQLSLVAL